MAEIGVTQLRIASPSTCTVQAPQSAIPHPNLVPVMLSASRRTQSSGMSGLTLTVVGFPLRMKCVATKKPPQNLARSRGFSAADREQIAALIRVFSFEFTLRLRRRRVKIEGAFYYVKMHGSAIETY